MDSEEKQKRVLKPARSEIRRRLMIYYAKRVVFVVVILGVLIVLGVLLNNDLRNSRSKKLIGNINYLANNSTCDSGLAKVRQETSGIGSSIKYTDAARERALEYLMVCNNLSGSKTQALNYANQLMAVYKKNGEVVQNRQVAQYINYIKQNTQ